MEMLYIVLSCKRRNEFPFFLINI